LSMLPFLFAVYFSLSEAEPVLGWDQTYTKS
jgi:hypothetical protein